MSSSIGTCSACGGSGYRYLDAGPDVRGSRVVRCECWHRRKAAIAQAPLPFKTTHRRTRKLRDGRAAAAGSRD